MNIKSLDSNRKRRAENFISALRTFNKDEGKYREAY